MNTPGVSLFQGTESIKVNSSLERQEEEEAIEDQRRRHEELDIMMQKAFVDLDDDETTIDSTTNFQTDLIDGGAILPQEENRHMQHEKLTNIYGNVANHGYADPHKHLDQNDHEKEIHQLKMMVESCRRELQHSEQLLAEEYKKSNDLDKKLAITKAELELANSSKKNNHELLVESKEKISNLENTVKKMFNERETIECEKNELLGKLETVQTLLGDVQRKYDMVERDLNKNQERKFEVKLKKTQDHHRAEITMLQQQMEQVANQLNKKSAELINMNIRYEALQRSHQTMLCEKANIINDLNHALNESQKRCEELLSRTDYYQENIRQQKFINSLQQQIQSMEKTINSLKERLEITTAELDSMDTLLHQHNQEDTPRRLSQTQGRVVGSTPLNTIDRMGNLKDELYRALANIKTKREEIRKLQQSLDDKQTEIKQLKEEENKSLVQISTLKEENIKLQNKLKVLEEDLDQFKTCQDTVTQQEDNRVHTLHTQVEDLKLQLDLEIQKTDKLEQYKLQQERERKNLDAQLKNLEIDLEELKQEHESLKLNYEHILKENRGLKQRQTADNTRLELEKHKFLLKDSQTECDRLKNLYVEISNAKDAISYEMDKLLKSDSEKDLQEEKEKVANLQRSLKFAEVKCSELSKILETEKLRHERELSDLRDKLEKAKSQNIKAAKEAVNGCAKCMDYVAELTKFEIQNLKLTNINAINKKEIDDLTKDLKKSKDQVTQLNEQLKLSEEQEYLIKELKTKATQFEEYIKSHSTASESSNSPMKSFRQMSDKSVITSPELERNQIKRIEARVRDEMAKIFAMELKRFQTKLRESQEQSLSLKKEVELLKQAIWAEKEKMDGILKKKDEQHDDELKVKLQKIKDLTNELNERQSQIEAERKSMKAVMKQWEEQMKSVDAVELDWNHKFKDLRKAHESALHSWQTKYNSAKRTAVNYKRYSEDKEAHMLKEYDRLKIEYDSQLSKIQISMKERLEMKSLELRKALDKNRDLHNNDKENTANN